MFSLSYASAYMFSFVHNPELSYKFCSCFFPFYLNFPLWFFWFPRLNCSVIPCVPVRYYLLSSLPLFDFRMSLFLALCNPSSSQQNVSKFPPMISVKVIFKLTPYDNCVCSPQFRQQFATWFARAPHL